MRLEYVWLLSVINKFRYEYSHQSAVPTAKHRCLCCRFSLFCSRWHSFVMNIRTKQGL
jgi:hypothetical protein